MGTYYAMAQNPENDEICKITRTVHYCTICRKDFHEGEAIKASVRKAVNLPPELKSVPTDNVFKLDQKKPDPS
jgi:hypothetical protein